MTLLDETRIPNDPYPELREVLRIFVAEIQSELAENLVGIYLVGSLASGDFDLDSDVDFLVVIDTALTTANITALPTIQRKIHEMDCYPARHLEGSYFPLRDLNNWQTVGEKKLWYFDNGSTTFEQSTHDNQWHVRWILRERGIALIGPAPETIVCPIPLEALFREVTEAMFRNMEGFEAEINRPLSFWNSQFGQSFAVLTYCRMLHTLQTGTVQSKKAGAEWASHFVDPRWIETIERAWHDRKGVRFGVKIGQRADRKLLDETLEFMKYAVSQIDRIDSRVSKPGMESKNSP